MTDVFIRERIIVKEGSGVFVGELRIVAVFAESKTEEEGIECRDKAERQDGRKGVGSVVSQKKPNSD